MTLLLIVLVVLGIVLFKAYNTLQRLGQGVRRGHADIAATLQKRADLLNKISDIAKEYGAHEKLTYISHSENIAEVGRQTQEAMGGIMAMAQAFPDLKANATYQQLMRQIDEIESTILSRREQYNAQVEVYNAFRLQLPQSFFAGAMGFPEAHYFDSDNLQMMKDFRTGDTEALKDALGAMGTKTAESIKKMTNSATPPTDPGDSH